MSSSRFFAVRQQRPLFGSQLNATRLTGAAPQPSPCVWFLCAPLGLGHTFACDILFPFFMRHHHPERYMLYAEQGIRAIVFQSAEGAASPRGYRPIARPPLVAGLHERGSSSRPGGRLGSQSQSRACPETRICILCAYAIYGRFHIHSSLYISYIFIRAAVLGRRAHIYLCSRVCGIPRVSAHDMHIHIYIYIYYARNMIDKVVCE